MVKTEKFILRYANCWEDADLLLQQINTQPGASILSICSGGENSLSLLCLDPKEVVVADVNPKQIYLLELKMAAVQQLEYKECLAFLGYTESNTRINVYHKIKTAISANARFFWDMRIKKIHKGLIYDGRVERTLKTFAKYYRPLIHSNKKVNELLVKKSEVEQQQFYQQHWNSIKWRVLFRIFFNNALLKFTAPDPDFFKYVNHNVGKYLFEKSEEHLSSVICQQNHILHYTLKGNFGNVLPHFVQENNFMVIKQRLGRIKFHYGFAQEILAGGKKFNAFNLSNIFEYTTIEEFNQSASGFVAGSASKARFVYWNILLPRKMSDIGRLKMENKLDTSVHKGIADKGWIYYRCIVDEAP